MPPLEKGQLVKVVSVESEAKETRPPPRYTEATLLSAMETAGKLVDDEELREAMKERGLGTPATRAETIETLIRREYIERGGKDLLPTPKGLQVITMLEENKLTSPELTGDWEKRSATSSTAGREGRLHQGDRAVHRGHVKAIEALDKEKLRPERVDSASARAAAPRRARSSARTRRPTAARVGSPARKRAAGLSSGSASPAARSRLRSLVSCSKRAKPRKFCQASVPELANLFVRGSS